ncbi:unnamed protein product [Lampetra planeri]
MPTTHDTAAHTGRIAERRRPSRRKPACGHVPVETPRGQAAARSADGRWDPGPLRIVHRGVVRTSRAWQWLQPRRRNRLLLPGSKRSLGLDVLASPGKQTDATSGNVVYDKLFLEGVVVQRADCRPVVGESYMKMKRMQIEESSKPMRLSQQLEKAVTTNYKPVANHQYNIAFDRRKKEEGKRARADKQQVLDMLFSAFEKHQYYNIRDLVDITKQPVTYLKDILREIGIYNVKGTHKNTWELKPEYRHYQSDEKSD